MEGIKGVKRIAIGLLCISSIALIGLNIYDYCRIRGLLQGMLAPASASDETAKTYINSQAHSGTAGLASASPGSGDKEAEDLRYQIAAAKEELASLKKQLSDEAAAQKDYGGGEGKVNAEKRYLIKIKEDPNYRELQKKGEMESAGVDFAGMFRSLNLSPEQQEGFKEVMADWNMARRALYSEYKIAAEDSAGDQQQAAMPSQADAVRSLDQGYEAKMVEVLGEEDYRKYKSYQLTRMQWSLVTQFVQSLGAGGDLTETQKEDLVEAIYNADRSRRSQQQNSRTLSGIEYYKQSLENMARTHEGYLNAAKEILSETQLEQFTGYLKNELDKWEVDVNLQIKGISDQTTGNDGVEKTE